MFGKNDNRNDLSLFNLKIHAFVNNFKSLEVFLC
jgi:hypothetical protein